MDDMKIVDELLEKVALYAGVKKTAPPVAAKSVYADRADKRNETKKEIPASAGQEDTRISSPLIRMQADIALAKGRRVLSEALRVVSEMALIPERELEKLESLKGNAALEFADYIENEYQTVLLAEYIRRQVR